MSEPFISPDGTIKAQAIHVPPMGLRIGNGPEPLLSISPEGEVTARDDVAAQEAAQVFLAECSRIVGEARKVVAEELRNLASQRTVCPVHRIPDCSPLLNGCTIPNAYVTRLSLQQRATEIERHGL